MDNPTNAKPKTLADLLNKVKAHDRLLDCLKECGMTGTAFEIEAQRRRDEVSLAAANLLGCSSPRRGPVVHDGEMAFVGCNERGRDSVCFAKFQDASTIEIPVR